LTTPPTANCISSLIAENPTKVIENKL
jgi:hypothetical protein